MSRLQDCPVKSEREAGMGLDWRQRQGEQAEAIIGTQPRQRESTVGCRGEGLDLQVPAEGNSVIRGE